MMRAAKRVLRFKNSMGSRSAKRYSVRPRIVFCGLCRSPLKSPKALAASGDVCLSCHMRGRKIRWLHVHGKFIMRARTEAGLSVPQFAELCKWSTQRQIAVERQVKVQPRVAVKLATAFAAMANDGMIVRTVFREWPLFVVLADLDSLDVEQE